MDVLAAAGRAIGRDLTPVAELKRNDRARVLRAAVGGGPATVIVKSYAPGYAERWARESAALSVLQGRGLPVPELLAVADDPALVVLGDAGTAAAWPTRSCTATRPSSPDRGPHRPPRRPRSGRRAPTVQCRRLRRQAVARPDRDLWPVR